MSRVGIITLVLFTVIFSGAANAEIFKWVDANGKVHFSDRKISTKAQVVNIKTGTETVSQKEQSVEERLMQQQKYVNFLQSERVERKEKREEAKQEEDKKRKLCAAIQDQLKGYDQGNYRWYELDEQSGERSFLSDDQIEAKKQQLTTELKKANCS